MSEVDVTETVVRRGTYVGDGNATQNIVLSTRPKFIKIYGEDGVCAWISDSDVYTKMHYVNTQGAVKFGTHISAITINDTGFTVSSEYANTLGVVYVYEWEV